MKDMQLKNEFNCKDIVITEQNTKALIISKDDIKEGMTRLKKALFEFKTK